LIASCGLVLGAAWASTAALRADDEPAARPPSADRPGPIGPTEDVPQPFVPLHPRTVEDRRQIEALQAFTAARALEDRRMLREAIELLEEAHKKDPESLAILRHLSRLCFALN